MCHFGPLCYYREAPSAAHKSTVFRRVSNMFCDRQARLMMVLGRILYLDALSEYFVQAIPRYLLNIAPTRHLITIKRVPCHLALLRSTVFSKLNIKLTHLHGHASRLQNVKCTMLLNYIIITRIFDTLNNIY